MPARKVSKRAASKPRRRPARRSAARIPSRPARPRQTQPPEPQEWQLAFNATTFRTNFMLTLSQSMIEMICAVADDVEWNRRLFDYSIHCPDNWVATSAALEKRGLLVRKTGAARERLIAHQRKHWKAGDRNDRYYECSLWELTPAGTALVGLLKVTGAFVEADAAIAKRSRRPARR